MKDKSPIDELYHNIMGYYPKKAGSAYEIISTAVLSKILNKEAHHDVLKNGLSGTRYQLDGLLDSKIMLEAKVDIPSFCSLILNQKKSAAIRPIGGHPRGVTPPIAPAIPIHLCRFATALTPARILTDRADSGRFSVSASALIGPSTFVFSQKWISLPEALLKKKSAAIRPIRRSSARS